MKTLPLSVLPGWFALATFAAARRPQGRRAPDPGDGANKPPLAADDMEKKLLAQDTTNAGASMLGHLKEITTNPKPVSLFIDTDFRGIGAAMVRRWSSPAESSP